MFSFCASSFASTTVSRASFLPDSNGGQILDFQGNEHSISFAALSDGTREIGGIYHVEYHVDEKGSLHSKRRLLRNADHDTKTYTVIDKIKDVTFSYEGKPTWARERRLPRWITMVLTLANPDGIHEQSVQHTLVIGVESQ